MGSGKARAKPAGGRESEKQARRIIDHIVDAAATPDEDHETLRALRESESRLTRSQVFANIGTWDWDIQTGDLYWSERIGPLFGYGDAVPDTTYENFLAAVHPDDRQAVIDAVNACVKHGADYDVEHRVVWYDGTVRWLLERGDVIRDEAGMPLHMLGVVQDVTERKHAQLAVERGRAVIQRVVQLQSQFIGSGDSRAFFNGALEHVLALTESEYGLVGEVVRGEGGVFSLHTHAVSSDDPRSPQLRTNMFGNANILGTILLGKRPRIVNDPRLLQMPAGLPELDSFLCVPLFAQEELVGVILVGNRPNGYTNAVIEELQPFFGACSHAIVGSRHVVMREQVERELVEAKELAEQASVAKSEFLSRMSHELRTPLNAILGFTQLLAVDNRPNANRLDGVREIHQAGNHLLDLINDVLDLATIEADSVELSIEAVSVSDLLHECFTLTRPMARARGLAMVFPDTGQLEWVVRADRRRLKQVVLNLLSNAVKYNREGGQVIVECTQTPDGFVHVAVTDTGVGLPADKQRELFQPFHRLGAAATAVGGTGIGLVITKALIEMMGGQIGFSSTPGQGSTFWVNVPVDPDASIAELVGGRQAQLEASPDNLDPISLDGVEPRVLVAEDNPASQHVLREQLALLGCKADVVSNGLEALRLWKPGKYDLVLTDCRMPLMDGFQLTAAICSVKSEADRHVPIIAVSANPRRSELARCRDAGMDDYLAKPVMLGELRRTLIRWLKPNAEPTEPHRKTVFDEAKIKPEIDLHALDEVVAEDVDLRALLFQKFFASGNETLAKIEAACQARAIIEVHLAAHKLKSGALTVGANGLGALCDGLEDASSKGDWGLVDELAPRLGPTMQTFAKKIAETFGGTP